MADEDVVETEEMAADDGGGSYGGAEFVPESSLKPKSDVYTLILVLTFLAFLAGCIIAGRELHINYDVEFFVFEKK